jgi:hypothetical protein
MDRVTFPPPLPPPIPAGVSPPPARKPPILAWWGMIPSVVFVVLQAVLGWPEAKVRASSPQYALSYLMGGMIAGLAIPFIIAWLVYLVSRRSQLAATIAYTLLVAVFCLSVVSRTRPHRQAAPGGGPAGGKAQTANFDDFSFDVPAGWQTVQTTSGQTRAMIGLKTTRGTAPQALVKVDVGKPMHPTARRTAESFAAEGGEVLPELVLIDGAEGVRVETTSGDLSRPRHVVVIFRGGQVYLIMAAAAGGADVSSAFDEVLRTWRWNEVE